MQAGGSGRLGPGTGARAGLVQEKGSCRVGPGGEARAGLVQEERSGRLGPGIGRRAGLAQKEGPGQGWPRRSLTDAEVVLAPTEGSLHALLAFLTAMMGAAGAGAGIGAGTNVGASCCGCGVGVGGAEMTTMFGDAGACSLSPNLCTSSQAVSRQCSNSELPTSWAVPNYMLVARGCCLPCSCDTISLLLALQL